MPKQLYFHKKIGIHEHKVKMKIHKKLLFWQISIKNRLRMLIYHIFNDKFEFCVLDLPIFEIRVQSYKKLIEKYT